MTDTPTRPAPVEPSATWWIIWSPEHQAWWRAKKQGYCTDYMGAGLYTEAAARHVAACCRPEKATVKELVPEIRRLADECGEGTLAALVAAALRSEPRPQPTSELREQLAGAKRWASRVEDDYRAMRQILTDVFKLGDDAWGLTLEGFREAAELAARSQGYVPTAEDVADVRLAAKALQSYGAVKTADRLTALASRLEAGIGHERTYTRDEVLRIATAAATMHKGYPGKGWDAADAALMAVEAERSPKEEG